MSASTGVWLPYDEALIDQISSAMDLRLPNATALGRVAEEIEDGTGREVVCDLATGVGKTYLAAALVEYLAQNGVRNILFVTPGKTIHDKTIANFTPGSPKFVAGAEYEPLLITADNFARGQVGDALHDPAQLKLFVFNVQQLIKPTTNTSRRTRADDEFIGGALYDHLRAAGDLVIIADEHHVYRASAKAFGSAIRDLSPRALVGLTATPDAADLDKVIYRYTLAEAIADQLVKVPVIVYRQDGLKDVPTQLADAVRLREAKEPTWHAWGAAHGQEPVSPVLFVVCQTIKDAEQVSGMLATLLPGDGAVLLVTSQSSDDALAALADVESAESPVRAIVSVDKLKEGWDVRNIGVIVGLRALASQTLTEQILGRGLRLPFGARTGMAAIDQVDLVAHESYKELLQNKEALLERLVTERASDPSLPPPRFTVDELDGVLRIVSDQPTSVAPGATDTLGGLSDADILIVSSIDDAEKRFAAEAGVVGQHMPAVKGVPHVVFPRRDRALVAVPFSLASVRASDAALAGKQYRSNETVTMQREAIKAERDLSGVVSVSTQKVEAVEATQNYVSAAEVRADLIGRVMGLGLVPALLTERLHAEELVDAFLGGAELGGAIGGAGLSGDTIPGDAQVGDAGAASEVEPDWTTKRAGQAEHALAALVRAAYAVNERQPSYAWNPITLLQPRPMPGQVNDWYSPFVVHEWYGGWNKSAEHAASFDSNTGEFAFATLADQSDGVRWWLRLYTTDPAFIRWGLADAQRYFPDFLVIDAAGVNWVVEAKSDAALLNPDVLAKKAAAEAWVVAVNESKLYGVWRYLLVGETDIKDASNWKALVAKLGPSAP